MLIYEQQSMLQDNSIMAEKGTMGISTDKKFLEFTLYNGHRYQERGNSMDSSTEFIEMGFKEYKKLFDLRSLQMMNTSDSVFRNDYKMLSTRLLNKSIDSLAKMGDSLRKKLHREVDKEFLIMLPLRIV